MNLIASQNDFPGMNAQSERPADLTVVRIEGGYSVKVPDLDLEVKICDLAKCALSLIRENSDFDLDGGLVSLKDIRHQLERMSLAVDSAGNDVTSILCQAKVLEIQFDEGVERCRVTEMGLRFLEIAE